MIAGFRNLVRSFELARTLARHDMLFPRDLVSGQADGDSPPEMAAILPPGFGMLRWVTWPLRHGIPSVGRPGQRLAAAFQALGPSFVKLGQTLATRPDLMGEEISVDLAGLHDSLPPFSSAEASATILSELNKPLDQLFADFDDTPIAAASIAQVHFATTPEGESIAVKVLRPGIQEAFQRDLDLFYWLARVIERLRPNLKRLKLVEVIDVFAASIKMEMDLRLEAAAASELRENIGQREMLPGDSGFRVPAVDWERTSTRVLTLQRVNGQPLRDRDHLVKMGHDVEKLAGNFVRAFIAQSLRDGFFHADLHPGNLFVDDDSNIVAVDFGIMGRLNLETRRYLAEIMYGFMIADYRRVALLHFQAGYVPESQSVDDFAQALRSIGEPILGRPANEISFSRLLAQLFKTTETFSMEVQPQLLLLQKTLVVVEGVALHLDPDINMWDVAQPEIERWMHDNLGPDIILRDTAETLFGTIKQIPRLIDRTEDIAAAYEGGLRLHPDSTRMIADQISGRQRSTNILLGILVALAAIALIAVL